MTTVSKKHVLIVEDDPELREALAQSLSDGGYLFSVARDGLEAIRFLQDGGRPAVILLDLSMPFVNGWEFRIHQKRTAAIADIPVVIITAGHHSREEIAWLEPADIIQKPINLQRLLDTVRRHCGTPQASQSG